MNVQCTHQCPNIFGIAFFLDLLMSGLHQQVSHWCLPPYRLSTTHLPLGCRVSSESGTRQYHLLPLHPWMSPLYYISSKISPSAWEWHQRLTRICPLHYNKGSGGFPYAVSLHCSPYSSTWAAEVISSEQFQLTPRNASFLWAHMAVNTYTSLVRVARHCDCVPVCSLTETGDPRVQGSKL